MKNKHYPNAQRSKNNGLIDKVVPSLGPRGWLFSSKFVFYGTDESDHLLWSQWSAVSRTIVQRQNHETDLRLFPAAVWRQNTCTFISQLNFTGLPVNKCFCMKLISNKRNKTKFFGKKVCLSCFFEWLSSSFQERAVYFLGESKAHPTYFVHIKNVQNTI